MDNLNNGGTIDLASDLTALPRQSADTLLILQKAKQSALELRKQITARSALNNRLIVALNNASTGEARMLTESEIIALRSTKQAIAQWTKAAIGERPGVA